MEMEDKIKPTIEECLKSIKEINKDIPQSEELLKNKADWLYIFNRLSFWNDIPIILNIIKYEVKKNNQSNLKKELSKLLHKYRIEMGIKGDCNDKDCDRWIKENLK